MKLKQHYFYYFLLSFVFLACNNSQKNNNSAFKYLSEYKPLPSFVDSIITGKELKCESAEEFTFAIGAGEKMKQEVSTSTNSNIYDTSRDTGYRKQVMPVKVFKNVIIDVLKGEPYISLVKHPKPIKAGELRSTGIANENIQYLDVEQGLPSSYINDMKEDSDGFLWIAHGGGLTKYDGYNFYTYTTKSGLPSNNIFQILITKDNRIWMATPGGLVIFDGKKFETYNETNGLKTSYLDKILEDDNGNIWFNNRDSSVCKYDHKQFNHYTTRSGLKHNDVFSIGLDSLNRVFVGYYGDVPDFIDGNTVYNYNRDATKFFGSDITYTLYRDKYKNLWLGHYSGKVVKWSPTANTHRYEPQTGFGYNYLAAILMDNKDRMWFGTGEGGLALLENNCYKAYTTREGLTSNSIGCLLKDRNNNIWVGTKGGGINKITTGSFKSYTSRDGMSDKTIVSITQNKKGEILFGTWANGLWAFNGKKFKQLSGYIGNRIILSALECKNGNLLVGSHQFGSMFLTPSKTDSLSYDSVYYLSNIPNFRTYGIYKSAFDSKNNIWLADINDGLMKLETNDGGMSYHSFKRFNTKSGLHVNQIYSLMVDDEDGVWIVYNSLGLSRLKNNSITHFTEKNGLPANGIKTLAKDKNGNVWIGTVNGIAIYNGKSFKMIDTKDGLSSNVITSIIFDNKNRVWVATGKGLNLLQPDSGKQCGYSISTFYIQDGLKAIDFIHNAALLDRENNIWWSTGKGLIRLNLNEFEQDAKSPSTYLQNINLMNTYVNYGALTDSLKMNKDYVIGEDQTSLRDIIADSVMAYANYPKKLVLPFNVNTVTFYFAALNGNSTAKIKYRYKLDGNDENWSSEINLPEAKYSNLSPGIYTFMAQAKVEGKDWGNECSYTFKIKPPFWETWWFRILSILILIFIVSRIFKWRNQKLIQRQAQLEQTVTERTHEINEQKHLIEEKQKEIIDSINYAKRIQQTLLAHKEFLEENLPQHFVYFNPKDIVSGDFYWATNVKASADNGNKNLFYFAVCDSTGHGVPGAFMSLLNIGFLNEAINEKGILLPNEIFDYVRKKLTLNMSKEGQKDGFDGILICLEQGSTTITYSAANNAPLLICNGQKEVQKHDRMPVGFGEKKDAFNLYSVHLKPNDTLYLYTDGFADQFGGPNGKKYKSKNLHETILSMQNLSLAEQCIELDNKFISWKNNLEQVDDVCVVGIKLK